MPLWVRTLYYSVNNALIYHLASGFPLFRPTVFKEVITMLLMKLNVEIANIDIEQYLGLRVGFVFLCSSRLPEEGTPMTRYVGV